MVLSSKSSVYKLYVFLQIYFVCSSAILLMGLWYDCVLHFRIRIVDHNIKNTNINAFPHGPFPCMRARVCA